MDFAKEVYSVAKEAHLVLELAGRKFAKLVYTADTCAIHTRHALHGRLLMEHERLRILHSWYFLKLYTESYRLDQPGGQRQALDIELSTMDIAQLYVISEMNIFLCAFMDWNVQEVSAAASIAIPVALTSILSYHLLDGIMVLILDIHLATWDSRPEPI